MRGAVDTLKYYILVDCLLQMQPLWIYQHPLLLGCISCTVVKIVGTDLTLPVDWPGA